MVKNDWENIATTLSKTNSNPDEKAKLAIQILLGDDWIKETVDYIIQLKPEWDLALKCLRILESKKASDYAYQIFKSNKSIEYSRLAVFVIKDIAHPESLNWVEEFINNPNVAGFGLEILDQLLWLKKIKPSSQTENLLILASKKSELLKKVNFIKDYLKEIY